MNGRNSVIRATDTISLATWFGGSLMGAVGLHSAAEASSRQTAVEGRGWSAWQPVQTAAIATQLATGTALTFVNKGRIAGQRGVAKMSLARTALTGAALGATVLAAKTGREIEERTNGGDGDGDAEVAELQKKARLYQWAVPALTGAVLAVHSVMSEQQRPNQVVKGTLQRVLPDVVADRLAA